MNRSWIGWRYVGRPWGLRWSSWLDFNTNEGFNNYEERLHEICIGPLRYRWYTLS